MLLSARSVVRRLSAVIVTLLLLHLGGIVVQFGLGHDTVYGLLPLVDLNAEQGFGTWYSSSALLLSAALLAVIARQVQQQRAGGASFARHWWGLAGVFALLSADEVIGLHERLGAVATRLVPAHGYLYFNWVVLGAAFAGVVGLVYVPFIVALPTRYRRLFLTAGLVFVGGAIGVEVLEAPVFEATGFSAALYGYVLVEEGMEMAGVLILIYALLTYAAEHFPGLSITVGASDDPLARGRLAPGPVPAPAYVPGARPTPRRVSRTPIGRPAPAGGVGYEPRATPPTGAGVARSGL